MWECKTSIIIIITNPKLEVVSTVRKIVSRNVEKV